MNKKTILVTGANGQLGSCMKLACENSGCDYIYTDVNELDITDEDAVKIFIASNNIDIIVNCAAYTNVDKAEDDKEFAYILNAKAVENLAVAAKENNALLIHISTDYVFDGTKNIPLTENDLTNPIGVYGVTKLQGEEAVINSGCEYIIIRTSWLYSQFGHNFVKTMLRLTSEKPQLKVVFDQVGSPTNANDLAVAIADIIENEKYNDNNGIYHYSNEGVCSWFDFTKVIAKIAGNTGCDIQPCHSSDFPSKVTRPNYSVMDKSKFKAKFNTTIPYWTDSLENCIKLLS